MPIVWMDISIRLLKSDILESYFPEVWVEETILECLFAKASLQCVDVEVAN